MIPPAPSPAVSLIDAQESSIRVQDQYLAQNYQSLREPQLDYLKENVDDKSCTSPSEGYLTWKERHLKGWRLGISAGIGIALVVALFNFAITISVMNSQKSTPGWRKLLMSGNCDRIRQFNSGSHVLISLLSTAMLSSTNYFLQCLSAPTREEIDRAHHMRPRRWLEIGVSSIRNLENIAPKRVLLWVALAMSSIPLHLL